MRLLPESPDLFVRHLSGQLMRRQCTTCRWDKLKLVRVYTKPHGKMPDYSAPVVLRSTRCTVEDFVSSRIGCKFPEVFHRVR